ncbi:hypothetical protein E2493_01260 [Sphingomonas parva]|uniref:Tetratricopeptide repeat protein n=1 Tax=Sphingomonas parva TaxID=2555898 RepID=A0A4Y8ZYA5_9SPHN|nr:hypothetical protein [Sphingomonas parva]TFI59909.1 hypothetical protein E2493_01260 [Sphingomonas parva]
MLAPVGALAGWHAVKTATVASFASRAPAKAAVLAPNDPQVRIGAAMNEFRARNGDVRAATRVRAIEALDRDALAEEPFLLAAVDALVQRDQARAHRLLLEARRRNPRSRLTRLVLLDRYMQTGRTREAAQEMAALAKLVTRTTDVLVPELTRMAGDPRSLPALRDVLATNPALRDAVLARLATTSTSPDVIVSLAGNAATATSASGWQTALLTRLVEKGDLGRAYRLWQSFGGQATGTGAKSIYDGAFQGRPGLPPFNWRFAANANGVGERVSGGGLQATFYGRADAELAHQLLLLAPGRYRIELTAEGDASGEGSRLVWRLSCHPKGPVLLDLPLTKINFTPRKLGGEFTVPAGGCPAQALTLLGVAAEFPTEQSVTIRDMKIGKSGS